jgi:hypothetical protein
LCRHLAKKPGDDKHCMHVNVPEDFPVMERFSELIKICVFIWKNLPANSDDLARLNRVEMS